MLTSSPALNSDLYVYNNDVLVHTLKNVNQIVNVFNIALSEGKNYVKAVITKNGSQDEISSHVVEFEKVKEPNPDYILHDPKN